MRRECRERFPSHRLQNKPLVNDPGMHHGTCVTHVPCCMPGSLTRGGGENLPGIPGACATRNFRYFEAHAVCNCSLCPVNLVCTVINAGCNCSYNSTYLFCIVINVICHCSFSSVYAACTAVKAWSILASVLGTRFAQSLRQSAIHQFHKSQNAPVPHPTMLHSLWIRSIVATVLQIWMARIVIKADCNSILSSACRVCMF